MTTRLGELTRVDRVRRNHALEHATISIITERHPTVFLSGRSNRKGFYIFGDIDTTELESAVGEALSRLRAGEVDLAIHPRCGTNLAVAGILSGVSAALAAQMRPRQNRFSYAVLAALGALMLAPGIGTEVQRHWTTLADTADLTVGRVGRRRFPLVRAATHWVETHST